MIVNFDSVSNFFEKYFLLSAGKTKVSDLVTIIPFIGFFLFMRTIIYFFVLRASPIIIKYNIRNISDEDLDVKKHRLADQCVKFIFHLTAALFAVQYFSKFGWWIPNLLSLEAYLLDDQSVLEKVYYMYQAGYHMHSLVHFFFLETKKKADDFVMGLHHIVTIILIFASYIGGTPYFQFGACVYYVHDASDIFIANVKIFHYLGASKVVLGLGLLISLAGWIYFRIFTFGVHIVLVAYYATYIEFITKGINTLSVLGVGFALLMSCLWLMHCYWLQAIVQSIFRVATKSSNFDASDSKEGSSFTSDAKEKSE